MLLSAVMRSSTYLGVSGMPQSTVMQWQEKGELGAEGRLNRSLAVLGLARERG